MKKDFSQPYVLSDKMYVGLLVEIPDYFSENRFVLSKVHPESTIDEYLPLGLEVDTGKQTAIQIAKYLNEKGLVLSSFREVVAEQSVEFALVDDTPGVIEKEIYYYVCADLATTRDDLIYINLDQLQEYIYSSPLVEPIDIAAVNIVATQRQSF